MRVGVISDTHGLLRPEALHALHGSDLILHAGDVGAPELLEALRETAPVQAVRGNNDREVWARSLPDALTLDLDGVRVHLLHDVKEITLDPAACGIGVVVSGHSHRPSIRRQGTVLFLNPGSAGPRRFRLPVTVARLHLERGAARAELLPLV